MRPKRLSKRARRLLVTGLVIVTAAVFSGCQTVGYYVQAVRGQCQLLASQRSCEKLLADPATDAELKAKLQLTAQICDVYHHFQYPESSMTSLHRALRPGGEVLLVEFKRIPGTSSDWVLNHVRAGQEAFTTEIKAAGFEEVEELDLLKDNYVVRFRKLRR